MAPFGKRRSETIGAWGEERLIQGIRRWLGGANPPPPAGIGDDCAVLPARAPQVRLLKMDPVVFGRHFDGRVPAAAAGAKLLKRNLSDLAAMGGRPAAAVVGLVASADLKLRWLEGFYRGMATAALRYGVQIVGGDVAQAPREAGSFFAAQLAMVGSLPGARPLTRGPARAGDGLYVTGVLGGSLASGHHHRFEPRLAEGQWLARRRDVRAMMDVSDGLAKDLPKLIPAGASAAVFGDRLPRRKGADVHAAVSDGEDYELLLALAHRSDATRFEAAFRGAFPKTRLTRIGFVAAGKSPPNDALNLGDYHGYEHLR